MNNKGFVIDNITLMVSMLVMLTLIIFMAAYISSQDTNVQNSYQDAAFKNTFHLSLGGFAGAADKGLVVGIVILLGFLLYSAYNIGTNFSLFLIALLMNMAALFLLPYSEDFLVGAFYNNNYATMIVSMPAFFYIINHYTIFLTGISVLLLIALFLPKGEASVA